MGKDKKKSEKEKGGEPGRGVELNEKREDGDRIEGRRKIRKRKNEKKWDKRERERVIKCGRLEILIEWEEKGKEVKLGKD